jgi:uncharacterized protein YeaO (DUF488 family)
MSIKVKRVYEPRDPGDGYRILVDRLWPRGVSRQKADVDLWLRDVAPSGELRSWFDHQVDRWAGFRERYEKELDGHAELLDLVGHIEQHRGTVTLLFGAHDVDHNQAQVLREVVVHRQRRSRN